MYQSEYPASSINILSSDTFEPNVVSKSPTMAELIPIYNAFFTASTLISERPPAKRRNAVGLIKRIKRWLSESPPLQDDPFFPMECRV